MLDVKNHINYSCHLSRLEKAIQHDTMLTATVIYYLIAQDKTRYMKAAMIEKTKHRAWNCTWSLSQAGAWWDLRLGQRWRYFSQENMSNT